jgi:hypothetical protein
MDDAEGNPFGFFGPRRASKQCVTGKAAGWNQA